MDPVSLARVRIADKWLVLIAVTVAATCIIRLLRLFV